MGASLNTDAEPTITIEPKPGPRHAPPRPPSLPWGEELPIFCERCGYSFNGLPQIRCEQCNVLHFACPECGNHQAINTLRPAFLRVLGRLRGMGLALVVFLKFNFFFWLLIAWTGFGTEISQHEIYRGFWNGRAFRPRPFMVELGFAVFILSFGFAAVGRMLMLRWRRGIVVGMILAGLVVLALVVGAYLTRMQFDNATPPHPFTDAFIRYLLCAIGGAGIGGWVVWGIWLALANTFLPKRTANALIEWQRAMCERAPASARTDAAISVTS